TIATRAEQRRESGLIDTEVRSGAAEMVEHDRNPRFSHQRLQPVDDRQPRVDLDVPRAPFHPSDDVREALPDCRRIGLAGRFEIEPDTADAAATHRVELR